MQISPVSRALLTVMMGVIAVASAGCSKTTTIRYQYRLAFDEGFTKDGDSIKAGAGEHFALYHIVCISTGDADFTFRPDQLYTTEPGATANNPLNAEYGIVAPVTVKAGTEKQNVGTVILRLKGSYSGNQPEPLFYSPPFFIGEAQESVLMSNDGFPNSYGPKIPSDTLDDGPFYEPGANLCKDPSVQSPH